MKNKVTAIIMYSLAAAIVVAIEVIAVISGAKKAAEAEICRIEFIVNNPSTAYADISDIADVNRGSWYREYLGTKTADADLDLLENIIRYHDKIENCECYVTHDTLLTIRFEPLEIILDFCEKEGAKTHHYASPSGRVFAGDGNSFTIIDRAPLRVVGPAPLDNYQWLSDITNFTLSIFNDPVLMENIAGLRVLEGGILAFDQKDCPTRVIYGDFRNGKAKIARYKRYLNTIRKTEIPYKSVDIRYSDQLVCKK